ncbi:hypothetical protein ACNKHV_23265 [Shigella flexneri]
MIAGFTTFLTMVYIVFVNPQILGVAGMDTSAVWVTTCLIAAFGSIMMGLFATCQLHWHLLWGQMCSSLLSLYRRSACRGRSGTGRDLLGRDRSAVTDDFRVATG